MNLLTFGFINYFIFICILCTFIEQSFATEKLNPPVAFPIFRPPLEAVQRYKTSAEHLQKQHSSQHLNDTQIEIEEISTNFSNDNNTFVEPSLEGLLGDVEEDANEEFIEGKINNNKTIIEEQKQNNTLENLGGNFGKLKNEIKLRHLNNSINATKIINTPQFPVFTGLGMEIIDVSPSNDAEKENKFKEEIPSLPPPPHNHQQQLQFNNHHKLHYYLNKNNTKLNKKYHPLKINKEQQQELPTTTIPLIQLLPTTPKNFEEENNPFFVQQNLSEQKLNKTENKQLNISENVGEDIEGINLINGTESNNNENKHAKEDINNKTIIDENKNISTSNTTITSITSSKVNLTEKDFSTSSPSITTPKILIEDFGRPNIRDELDNGFERVTMHLVDIPSTTTELVNNGSIIVEEERPSQHHQQTTTQNILTFNGIPFNLPSTKPPPPSKTIEQLNTNLFTTTTTIIPSNTLNSPPPPQSSNDKNEVLIEQQHSHIEFPQINNNLGEGDDLINNQGNEKDKNENSKINGDIEREMENKENFVQEENLNKNGDIGESMKRTSKFSTSTNSSDNLRIFVLLGIITILLVTIALASIFSARYVKRSRQLHGKYQPAAYEMQTQQQQQNRYQPTDFVNTQIYRQPPINNNFSSPPSNSPSIQQQITATFGKEERLI